MGYTENGNQNFTILLMQTNCKEQKEWGDCVTAAILINAQINVCEPWTGDCSKTVWGKTETRTDLNAQNRRWHDQK